MPLITPGMAAKPLFVRRHECESAASVIVANDGGLRRNATKWPWATCRKVHRGAALQRDQ